MLLLLKQKKAISDSIKKFYLTRSHPSKGLKGKLSPQYGIGSDFVFCYNQKGEELIFPSINAAKVRYKKSIDIQIWVTYSIFSSSNLIRLAPSNLSICWKLS